MIVTKGNIVTNSGYTHIELIIDRSGSMSEFSDPPRTKAQDATKGVHDFIRKQRDQPGQVTFSLTQFNTVREQLTSFSDGRDLLPSGDDQFSDNGWECSPHGGTALLDAIGYVITKTGQRLEKMDEADRPGKVIILIWTDGKENSSVKYPKYRGGPKQIADMIAHQRDKYGWQFTYMGIGEEAYLSAAETGFTPEESVFAVSMATADSYDAVGDAVTSFRSGQAASVSYSAGVRTKLADDSKTTKVVK